jgi:hypothetical protein
VELDPILNQTRFEIWKLEKFRNLEKTSLFKTTSKNFQQIQKIHATKIKRFASNLKPN